jgi:CheY-like chemotaxis protein
MIIDTPHPTILIAEDDLEDRMLTEEAFAASHLTGTLQFVEDGAELLQYLRREGAFTDPASSRRPASSSWTSICRA